jgi:hypothetical protein
MTKAEEFWQERGVFNSHDLVRLAQREIPGLVPIWLAWSHNDGSRMNMGTPNGYQVLAIGFKTDDSPGSPWYLHGRKTFETFMHRGTPAEMRHVALREAQDWCNLKYGIARWGKIPGFPRDWFPIEVVEWAKKKVREGR